VDVPVFGVQLDVRRAFDLIAPAAKKLESDRLEETSSPAIMKLALIIRLYHIGLVEIRSQPPYRAIG
jgi:hypothetical protein